MWRELGPLANATILKNTCIRAVDLIFCLGAIGAATRKWRKHLALLLIVILIYLLR